MAELIFLTLSTTELIFFTLSLVYIIAAWLWTNAGSINDSPLPPFTHLDPFEIAALRDGRKGVIYTALFKLWNSKLLTLSGKGHKATIYRTNNALTRQPEGFEKTIFHFVYKPRQPVDFFRDTALRKSVDRYFESINQKLEKRQLKRTDSQMKQAQKAFWITLFILIGTGCIFCYFDMGCLSILAIMIILSVIVLKPKKMTWRGRRYYKKLIQYFEGLKSVDNFDPAIPIAVYGVRDLSYFDGYAPFKYAFDAKIF